MAIETISVTITRDDLAERNEKLNCFLAGTKITKALLLARIPVIGVAGVLAIERGKLVIRHEDGLDGDEWTYTFTGEPILEALMPGIRAAFEAMRGEHHIMINRPLAPREARLRAEEEEL